MTSPPNIDRETEIRLKPGETRAEFIARVVAAAKASGPPDPEVMEQLRDLLPPVQHQVNAVEAA